MINWKDTIFTLFPSRDKHEDINKDVDQKGTLERYNEVVGLCIDDELGTLIDNLVDNTRAVDTCEAKFIPYLESRTGSTIGSAFYATEAYRRAILKHVMKWYRIKGTKRLLRILLGMLGLQVVITENHTTPGLDSPITFDDSERVFDGKCNTCTTYGLALTGVPVTMTPTVFSAMIAILKFNTPISAHLTACSYNGAPAVTQIVDITVAASGDLTYDNPYDPTLEVVYDGAGQPVITTSLPFYEIISPTQLLFVFLEAGAFGGFSSGFDSGFN